MTQHLLAPGRERWLLLTIAGIQFTHILDFMIMMPLGPQFTRLFGISDAQFGLLVSAYTFSAGFSGLAAATYVDRFDRKRLLLVLYGLFALATLACGLAPGYGTVLLVLTMVNAVGATCDVLGQSLMQQAVPAALRGRASGAWVVAIGVGPVGQFQIGVMVTWFQKARPSRR